MFVCIYIVLLSFLAPAAAYVPHSEGRMDRLAGLDIFLNVPKADFLSRLRRLVVHILKSIRSDLFDSAKQNDLVNRLDASLNVETLLQDQLYGSYWKISGTW